LFQNQLPWGHEVLHLCEWGSCSEMFYPLTIFRKL